MNITCLLYLLQRVSADLCGHHHVVLKIYIKKVLGRGLPFIDTTYGILISWLFQIV